MRFGAGIYITEEKAQETNNARKDNDSEIFRDECIHWTEIIRILMFWNWTGKFGEELVRRWDIKERVEDVLAERRWTLVYGRAGSLRGHNAYSP